MSAEKLPHEGLPRYTESIAGTWVSERWSGGELDPSRRVLSHYTVEGRSYSEHDTGDQREGFRLSNFTASDGILIFSSHTLAGENYRFRDLEIFQDREFLLFWRPTTNEYWWQRRLTEPPPYAYGFVDSAGVLQLQEPSEPAERSLITWRKPVKIGF